MQNQIRVFELSIYNELLWNYILTNPKYFTAMVRLPKTISDKIIDPKDFPERPKNFFLDFFESKGLVTAERLVKAGAINENWMNFGLWWFRLVKQNKILFRKFGYDYLKYVETYGNDRGNLTSEYDEKSFMEADLPKSEVIWATEFLDKISEIRPYDNPQVVSLYFADFFSSFPGTDYSVYAYYRKNREMSFLKTLAGVIVMKLENH